MSTSDGVTKKELWTVIWASSVGTLIEWYDFFVFGSLATIIAANFFPKENETAAFLATLATFATGFVVRPFGALVFGRIGDVVGRKHAFLVTLLMMGGATALVGLLPTYSQVGVLAPALLVMLRLVQGLALGGEYGGAATYVAEHAPDRQRGFYTSFIQITATLGLFVSLAVIFSIQKSMSKEAFDDYGWRIPFLVSILLLGVSYYIRRRLHESPAFLKLKKEGKVSRNPLKEAFATPESIKLVLIVLFGATAGQGVVWYTGQFHAMYFLEKEANVSSDTVKLIIASALLIGTPLFVFFGWLSDRIGRKWLMLSGCLLGAVSYFPIYSAMIAATGADFSLAKPVSADPNVPMLIGLVFIQVVFVTMVYGPIAAFLVETFPTRIRYTAMSLPYHIGNGVFGGMVPFITKAVNASAKSPLPGLWYPVAVALVTVIVGAIFLKDRHMTSLDEDSA